MKFAIGHQLAEPDEPPFAEIVNDYREHISEVYFAWPGMASGRAAVGQQRGAADWTAQARLEEDLRAIRSMGINLDILFNANCYGGRALSEELENEIGSLLEYLGEAIGGVQTVTTASLMVARTVKQHFPHIEVRASVNMRLGTIEAMRYVADLFDSFYLQRDRQRDLSWVREATSWCDANSKGLCLLANSGCLAYCPGQTFHDNLVAHDREIGERKNISDWTPHVCWRLYRDRANWPAILQATWIRPEDVKYYEGLAKTMKLATRMHSNPRMVVEAYTSGQWPGNLLDLLEPGLSPVFAPYIIANDRFPADWYQRTSTCDRRCHACDYCPGVLAQVLVKMPE